MTERLLESRAEAQIAAIEQRLAKEVGIIERTIATVKAAMAKAFEGLREVLRPVKPTITAEELRYVNMRRAILSNQVGGFKREDYEFWTRAHKQRGENYETLLAKVQQGAAVLPATQAQSGWMPSAQTISPNPLAALEAQVAKLLPLDKLNNLRRMP